MYPDPVYGPQVFRTGPEEDLKYHQYYHICSPMAKFREIKQKFRAIRSKISREISLS
jgi:hypothetical protein